ncbi:hypothetical protein [Marinobacter sp. LV10R510-11A]|uniref:hypothetical protein n=1 Tax=Marinobacter sp. LV10R510-11A TaxID=1415568 RepID=UPI0012FE5163|nr:hypothetical protein [Marinobacter sp. LV10R510-11A]
MGNLTFSANGIDGETDAAGRFGFNVGEPVTFRLAGLDLGTVTLSGTNTIITPAELRGETRGSEPYGRSTRNLLRLLQTLDRDGNPENGIDLPSPTELENNGLADVLAGQQLDDPNFDTQIASALVELNESFNTATALVDEESALAHFDLTLEGLQLPGNILTLSDGTISQWDVYTQNFGEYAGRLTLNDSVSGTYEEWNQCSDEGDDRGWIGTRARAEDLCSSQNASDITWQVDGRTFSFTNGAIRDTCTILSGDRNRFTASCNIDLGADRQIEVQYFVRTGVDRFNDQLVTGEFTEFSGGTHLTGENSFLTLEADKTGGYEIS